MKIALVVGHNATAQGAYTLDGNSEFTFNSLVAQYIKTKLDLERLSCEVFFRQKNWAGISAEIQTCYTQVNAWNPTFIIELHFNWSDNSQVAYASAWHHYRSTTGKRLSEIMVSEFAAFGNGGAREILPGKNGFLSASFSKAPLVLMEPFFGSNPGHVTMAKVPFVAQNYIAGIKNCVSAMMPGRV